MDLLFIIGDSSVRETGCLGGEQQGCLSAAARLEKEEDSGQDHLDFAGLRKTFHNRDKRQEKGSDKYQTSINNATIKTTAK